MILSTQPTSPAHPDQSGGGHTGTSTTSHPKARGKKRTPNAKNHNHHHANPKCLNRHTTKFYNPQHPLQSPSPPHHRRPWHRRRPLPIKQRRGLRHRRHRYLSIRYKWVWPLGITVSVDAGRIYGLSPAPGRLQAGVMAVHGSTRLLLVVGGGGVAVAGLRATVGDRKSVV